MKLGIFTPVFGKLTTAEMIAKVRSLGLQAVELGTGGWPGSDHLDLDGLLQNSAKVREYRQMIQDAGLVISALSCHGNPVHPERDTAAGYDDVFQKSVRLAE